MVWWTILPLIFVVISFWIPCMLSNAYFETTLNMNKLHNPKWIRKRKRSGPWIYIRKCCHFLNFLHTIWGSIIKRDICVTIFGIWKKNNQKRIVYKLHKVLSNTIFDICYVVGMMSKFMSISKWSHYQAVVRILRYIKWTLKYGVCFLLMLKLTRNFWVTQILIGVET